MYRQNFPDDPGMHRNPGAYTRAAYRQNPTFKERVSENFVAVIVGIVLLVVSLGLLFWNEGRAVSLSRSLDEGLRLVHSLPTAEVAFEENNGKLVHISGQLRTDNLLFDSNYDVAVQAVKLKRSIEMYQWVEQEHKRTSDDNGETRTDITYSYSKEWRPVLIASSDFYNSNGHENPSEIGSEAHIFTAKEVFIGNFRLSEGMIDKVDNYKKLEAKRPPVNYPFVKVHKGDFYHSHDILNPKIGDSRVWFEYAGVSGTQNSGLGAPDIVSVVGRQQGSQLEPFELESGNRLEFLYMGAVPASTIFNQEQASNILLTWGLRFVGWLLAFIGFGCLAAIVVTLADQIPFIGNLIAIGVHTMNSVLALGFSLTIIALGWITYRPWLGFSVLLCACLPFLLSSVITARRRRRLSRQL